MVEGAGPSLAQDALRESLKVSAGYIAFCGVILNNGEIKDPAT